MTDGNIIITGSGAPTVNTKRPDGSAVVAGDIYFNSKQGDVYTASETTTGAISWSYDLNIIGPQGVPFNEVLTGIEDPTPSTNRPDGTPIVTGDFYLNGTTGDLFRASVNTATKVVTWTKAGNIRGPIGPAVDTTGLVKCTPPAQFAASANYLGYNAGLDQIVARRADEVGGMSNDGWYSLASTFGGIKGIGIDETGPYLMYTDGSRHYISIKN